MDFSFRMFYMACNENYKGGNMKQADIDTLRVAANTCSSLGMTLSEEPHRLTQKDIAEIREQLLKLRRDLRYVQIGFNQT